jgi:regulator of protease activity HflC (stomatin/prohibitin superfamily)
MPEGFNGVVYRLGKIPKRSIRPGLYFRLPNIYRITFVSVQVDVVEMPEQRVLIEDGASVTIRWVLVIKVIVPSSALRLARDYKSAVREYAQSVGADNVRNLSLEKLVSKDDSVSDELERELNEQVGPYGVEIVRFAAVDFGLSETLQQATEQVIQARLDAKADLINAEREHQLAKELLKAADLYIESGAAGSLSKGEIALRLRELGTFEDMGKAQVLVSSERH